MDEDRAILNPRPGYTRAECKAVSQQLERILAHPLFQHSKRYPNLLRHVVERTLAGHAHEMKERTIGCEIFGREPDYDTNSDPVVRTTAGEVRKRIAQYYFEPGHDTELRIDLSPGSYVPEFVFPPLHPAPAVATAPAVEEAVHAGSPAHDDRGEAEAIPPVPELRGASRRRVYYAVAASVVVVAVAVAAWQFWPPRSVLDQFWGPVLDSPSVVRLCVGQRHFLGAAQEPDQQYNMDVNRVSESPLTLYKLYYLGSQNVALPDVVTLSRLAGLLQARGKPYHVQAESYTTLENLRDGPVVLVGAFNNDWTMRLTGPMRFGFQRDKDLFWISDHRHPERRDRSVDYSTPYMKLTRDYALISRVLAPTTDRMVVVAAGLTGNGTMAAGEFLTNPEYMESVLKNAPGNWGKKNLQVVIGTEVINGNSGPPRVVDQYFW